MVTKVNEELHYKLKGLCSDPQHHIKAMIDTQDEPVIPVLGRWEQQDPKAQ